MKKYFTTSSIASFLLIKISLIIIFGAILSEVLGFNVGFKQLKFMILLFVVILISSLYRMFIYE